MFIYGYNIENNIEKVKLFISVFIYIRREEEM